VQHLGAQQSPRDPREDHRNAVDPEVGAGARRSAGARLLVGGGEFPGKCDQPADQADDEAEASGRRVVSAGASALEIRLVTYGSSRRLPPMIRPNGDNMVVTPGSA